MEVVAIKEAVAMQPMLIERVQRTQTIESEWRAIILIVLMCLVRNQFSSRKKNKTSKNERENEFILLNGAALAV